MNIISRSGWRDAKRWIIFCVLLLVAVDLSYRVHAHHAIHGVSGGDVFGLIYGSLGTLAIIIAMLLLAKKTWRTNARFGSAYWWMQLHVWFGLVSYPLIWYHAGWNVGWHVGGPLTTWLMWIFTFVWLSGIIGLALQNFIPRALFERVTTETIFDQIDHVGRQNLKIARRLVRAQVGGGNGEEGGAVRTAGAPGEALKSFYEMQVRPYLASRLQPGPESWGIPWRPSWRTWLGPAMRRTSSPPPDGAFATMRTRYPALAGQIDALESLVTQRKQHRRQKQLHWWLHGWLLLHLPLSIILMVLIPLHAVLALRYF